MDSWRSSPLAFLAFLLPGALWLIAFFVVPLGLIWLMSFGERAGPVDVVITGTLANYGEALNPLYLGLFAKSLWIALVSTALCLVVGLPVALGISFAPPRLKPLLLLAVVLPFWTNMLIRTYAMIAVLRPTGVFSEGVNLGLEQVWTLAAWVIGGVGFDPVPLLGDGFTPVRLLRNNAAVVLGIVYIYLPFMVLPLYATLERLDRSYLEASLDLGASQFRTFFSVVVPLARPGIVSGVILVFIPAIGTFLISDLLGGTNSLLLGNVVERQFKAANNWPLGAAMSFLLMYVTFAALAARSFMSRGTVNAGF